MVAIIGGNGLGIQNSSAATLGQAGLFGSSTHGAAKESAYVNAATGNLVLSDRDEWLASLGINVALTRTYNSQGSLNIGMGQNWNLGPVKKITGLVGTVNAAGSTVTRVDGDGSTQLYTYDSAAGVYRSTDGDGAYDTLARDGDGWVWLGEQRNRDGVYERYDAAGRLIATGEHGTDRVTYGYGTDGKLETVTDARGDVSRYEYVNGNLARIRTTPADGSAEVRTSYQYDAANRLKVVTIDMTPKDGVTTDNNVFRINYEYWDDTNRVKSVTQSDNTALNFVYDDQGRVRSVTDALQHTTFFDYSVPGRTTVTDPMGNKVAYLYDAKRQLTGVATYVGGTEQLTSYFYDDKGNVLRTVAPSGRVTAYEYDGNGNRVLERDADGRTVTRTYDLATNLLLTETTYAVADPDGAGSQAPSAPMTRRFFYDSASRLRFVLSPVGKVTEYRYNAASQLTAELQYNKLPGELSPMSEQTLTTWAAGATAALAERIDIAYDLRGQLASRTTYATFKDGAGVLDGSQTVLRYTYDQSGQLLYSYDGRNAVTTYTYDELGRLLTQKDPNGVVAKFSYIDTANYVMTTYTGAGTTKFFMRNISSYDAAGNLSQSYGSTEGMPVYSPTIYEYDADARVRASYDAHDNEVHTLYDATGRKQVEIVNGTMTEYVYDQDGLLVRTVRYAAQVDKSLLLDAGGNLLYPTVEALRPATLAAANRSTWNSYDARGRLLATVDPNGYLTRMEYDGAGRLVRTIARAQPVDTALIVGNRIPDAFPGEASEDDRVSRMFYDSDDKVVATLDGSGYLTEFVYDAAGRLVDTVTHLGAAAVKDRAAGTLADLVASSGTNVAHQRNVYDGKGQLVGKVDAGGYLTEITYDPAGNVTRRRQYATPVTKPDAAWLADLGRTTSALDRITSYTYNSMNQLLTETTPEGDVVTYGYDNNGRQVSVTRSSPTSTARTSQRRYDGAGNVTGELSEEGVARLTALGSAATAAQVAQIWAAYGITYTYDIGGRRTSVTDQLGNKTLYLYENERVAAVINAAGDWERYTYDGFGDLIEVARYTVKLTSAQIDAVGKASTQSAALAALPKDVAALYTKYYYDNEGRKVYTANADGSVQQTEFNAFDQVTRMLQYRTPLSQVAAAISDRGYRSGAATDLATALGGAASAARVYYDNTGHAIYTVDANNGVESRTYDARGNVTGITQYGTAAGALTGKRTDLALLAALAVQGRDRTQSFVYDLQGRLSDAVDASSYHTTTHYNAFGQADLVTRYFNAGTPSGTSLDTIVQTLYDRSGRVRATVGAGGALTTYRYDADGRVVEKVTYANPISSGASVAAIEDAITRQSLADPQHDLRQRFVYDDNGRLKATLTLQTAGKPAAGADPSSATGSWSVVSQAYDNAGRLIERTAFALAYASTDLKPTDQAIKDWIANPANARDTDNAVRYAYDADNRVVSTATAQRGSGDQREWAVVQVVYDDVGNVAQRIVRATVLKGAAPTAAQMAAVGAPAAGATSFDAITYYKYDALGREIASAKALGAAGTDSQWALTTREYDAAGNLVRLREYATALVNVTAPSQLTGTAADGLDRVTRYSYDAGNRLVATVDADGSAVRLEYDARGNVVKSTRYLIRVTGTGLLGTDYRPAASSTDRVTRTYFDADNRPVYQVDAEGAVTRSQFDAAGNVTATVAYATRLLAADLAKATQVADIDTLLIGKSTADDRKQYFAYYPDGRLRYAIDGRGYLSEKQYDVAGRVVAELQFATPIAIPANASNAAILNAAWSAASAQAPNGTTRVTRYAYDAGGNLASVVDALGKSEAYTYDAQGHKKTFTNKLGNTWSYDYDAAGRLVSETSPPVSAYGDATRATIGNLGAATEQALVTRMAYDTLGNLQSRTEAYGIAGKERTTEYRYDALGRQTQTILPSLAVYDAAQAVYAWDTEHAVTETASGVRTVTVTYDALGNAVSNTDVGGKTSYKLYDKAGRVRWEVDASGYVTGYERDAFGAVKTMTRYAAAVQAGARDLRTTTADDFEKLLSTDTTKNRTIRYTYDATGRTLTVSEPVAAIYDLHATNAKAYQDAGRKTVYQYNAFGEVYRQSVYGADAAGNQVTEAAVTRFYYNLRGEKSARIDALSDIGGQRSGYLTTYEYDLAGNLQTQVEYATAFGTWTDTDYKDYQQSAQDRTIGRTYDKLNRLATETRVNVLYAGTSTPANLVTRFGYDDVGNRTSVIDATGGATYTYFDRLGRTVGTAHKQVNASTDIADAGVKITEFRLDVHGNAVLTIEYANRNGSADANGFAAPAGSVDDRITAVRYDNWGRALEMVDAEQFSRPVDQRKAVHTSYDVYGRLAKQWRTVADSAGHARTTYQIVQYDELGRASKVITPGLINLVAQTLGDRNTRVTAYNAFGEVEQTYVADKDGKALADTLVTTKYDLAGHAWLSNADGPYKVRLYDAQGNVTAILTGTAARTGATDTSPGTDAFAALASAADALRTQDVLRTDNRYDLLGHLVDSRVVPDSRLNVLVREGEAWVKKTVGSADLLAESLVVLGDAAAKDNRVAGLRYRIVGGAWTVATAARLRTVNGSIVFDTAGLPQGDYEYEVSVQPGEGPAYVGSGGVLRLTRPVDAEKDRQIIQMYLMMYNRAADLASVNFWINSANAGVSTAGLFEAMLKSDEARGSTLVGSANDIVTRIFSKAFGTTQLAAGGTPEQIAHWVQRWTAAATADAAAGTNATAERGLVLADLLAAMKAGNGAGFKLMDARASAIKAYVVTYRGGDTAFAQGLLAAAATNADAAYANAVQTGSKERTNVQLTELYIAILGRLPDAAGLASWASRMQAGATLAQVAEGMLADQEAALPSLYPSTGLTQAQYNEQLVRRMYQLALNRVPSSGELAGWLAKLTGTSAISRGQFTVQFLDSVNDYAGTDAVLLADKQLFNNRVSIAYTAAAKLGITLPTREAAAAFISGITAGGSAVEAAQNALAAAQAVAALATTVRNAADVAAAATPQEEMRRVLTRMYVVLLGRLPDKAGLESYLAATPATPAQWTNIAQNFLRDEGTIALGADWAGWDNRTFVTKLYENALGSIPYASALGVLPNGPAVQQEINSYVALLNSGATRYQVAYQIAAGMLTSAVLNADEQKARALLDNKVALGITASMSLKLADQATQRTAMGKVTDVDYTAALNYAYASTQSALTTALGTLTSNATAAASLADAVGKLASATIAASSAASALDANAAAKYRLQVTQLYVGLLGRSETSPIDVAGMQHYVDNQFTPAQVAQDFVVNASESARLYPATLTNAQFVDAVVKQVLGDAALLGSDVRARWVADLGKSPAPTRGKVALDILASVLDNTNGTATTAYLRARADLLSRVSAAYAKLHADTTAEVNRLNPIDAAQGKQVAQDQEDVNYFYQYKLTSETTRDRSLKAASDALAAANSSGDGYATTRLLIIRMYASVLRRAATGGTILLTEVEYQLDVANKNGLDRMAQDFLTGSGEFPATESNSTFITKLYNRILGRNPETQEITYYNNFLAQRASSPTARGTAVLDILNNYANKYTENTYLQLQAKKTFDTKIASYIAAIIQKGGLTSAASASYSALAGAHPKVITADQDYITAVDYANRYDAAKKNLDIDNATYQATHATLTAYQAEANLEPVITKAAATAASKAAAVATVATGTGVTSTRLQTLTQLYFTLLNRAPTLVELYLAMDRMTGNGTLAEIADGILQANTSQFPASQTNEAFVRLLYTNGLNRDADTAGLNYYLGQMAKGSTRAQLVAEFVTATNANNNADTVTYNDRAKALLTQIGAATATSSTVDAVIDAAADQARKQAALYDASAAAALAANVDAQRTLKLARLYVAIFGRTPDVAGLSFYLQELRANPAETMGEVAQKMLNDGEARTILPPSLGNPAFVTTLFQRAFGRSPTAAELTDYTGRLSSQTRGAVVAAIVDAMVGYQGTDRAQLTAQAGFTAKVGAALGQFAKLAASNDQGAASIATALQQTKPAILNAVLATPAVAYSLQQAGSQTNVGTSRITVDRWGNVISVADPRNPNYRITYQYNYDNQQIAQTANALASADPATVAKSATTYDALGRIASQSDFRGYTTSFKYDSNGNVAKEIHADGGVVDSTYNLFGNRLTVKQPDTDLSDGKKLTGVLTKYSYDHLGHLLSTTTGAAVDVYVAINGGLQTFDSKFVGSKVLTQQYKYDELGRQIRSIGADGVETTADYDADGNIFLTETYDPTTGNHLYTVKTAYDALHRKIATMDANGATMGWQYANGALWKSTDMGGAVTTYVYDQSGRVVRQTSTRKQDIAYTYAGVNLVQIEDKATFLTTRYTYDKAGNRLREWQTFTGTGGAPARLQNNTLSYDMQNRLTDIVDDMYELKYGYDENGNRTSIQTRYTGLAQAFTVYNAYDEMNRQTVVNGEMKDGHAVHGAHGHAITYDKAGNRLTDTFIGPKVLFDGNEYSIGENQETTESYTYDAAGRLSTVTRDMLVIDYRRYDSAGRISQSGVANWGNADLYNTLYALGIQDAGHVYSYDAGGHVTRQRDLDYTSWTMRDIYFVKWTMTVNGKAELVGGYDAAGNLLGYTIVPGHGSNTSYLIGYEKYDTYKESVTALVNGTTNESLYDVNGNRVSLKDKSTGKELKHFWYDADGHVQSASETGKPGRFNLIVNGQMLGEETKSETNYLGSNYLAVNSSALTAPPSTYTVQNANETCQSIAQSIWGDANLWYLIADANGLDANADLKVGDILRIPTRVNTVHGDYGTYKPYDASEQIGNTAPMAAPKSGGGGCGGLGQLVMIVVAIVATIYTAGAASSLLAGQAIGSFGATMAAGSAAIAGGSMGAAAIGGALGSIASQAVGIAIGAQDSFSWKGVALSAIGSGISAGMANIGSSLGGVFAETGTAGQVARAALGNVVTQGAKLVTGLQQGFDWRGVAASAAGAAAGAAAGNYLGGSETFNQVFGSASPLVKDTLTGIASGTAASIVRGGKIDMVRIATDAFGNALGDSLVRRLQGEPPLSNAQQAVMAAGFGPVTDEAAKRKLSFGISGASGKDTNTDAEAILEASLGTPEEFFYNATHSIDELALAANGTAANQMIVDWKRGSSILIPYPLGPGEHIGSTMVGRTDDYVPEFVLGTGSPAIKPDQGSGAWNTTPASVKVLSEKYLLEATVLPALSPVMSDAVDFLHHYLDNSGTDYKVDLKRIVETTEAGRDLYITQRNAAMAFAMDNAVDGQMVSFHSKRLDQFTFTDNNNWYYAVGNFSGWSSGSVTKNGEKYSMNFDLHFYDRYNWNKGKAVEIFGQKIYDDDMGMFHKMGIAKEFNTVGKLPLIIQWTGADLSNAAVKVRK